MKFLFLTLLTQIIISAPLLTQILGTGGVADVDLSGLSVLSSSSDTTKININKGYGNYVGPQHAPAPVYSGYDAPVGGGPTPPQLDGFQQLFNPGFQRGLPAQGFPQGFPQSRGNQLKAQRT
ncbi:hypothetical protein CONCODRAFT_13827 [Conidiobolus coronatus NRRL 28638]|uniref:Secreted protein n=1 Tax=Conidiobolus coronatus (strain ATCC 28846 / CBS 209.66 / NRRL 28638) TaxID=796925 RepID=A0A137NQ70_CONC2|nr:hypothetical protein CONCODRAFT_13827 [Conidiobolus coronatus NRRL 28638]|eukprot:KXN64844.1 hypothetical protein CONCODRAFT_13827 [Conidiobolus coronatus NRRL 28638]